MVKPERKKIVEQVQEEAYEEVLGISCHASLEEIHRAHIRLLFRYRDQSEAVEAINSAKSRVMNESHFEKGRRLVRLGRMEEALPYLRKAAQERGYAIDFRYLGCALVELGLHEEALPQIGRAVELGGDALDWEILRTCQERMKNDVGVARRAGRKLQRLVQSIRPVFGTYTALAASLAAGVYITNQAPDLNFIFFLIVACLVVSLYRNRV